MTSPAQAQEAPQESHAAEGGEHAGSLAHGGAHEGGGFPPFESENFAPQLVWLALVFGVLYVLMSRLALPRVANILEKRETTIGSDLDAARDSQSKAQAAAQHNDATLRAKKDEAQAIGRDAQARVAAEVAALRASAEQKFSQEIAAAEARIAAEKADKLTHVESIAQEAAAAIVAKLTGAQVDAGTFAAAARKLSAH
jgi:F-type H+-transporting ATPase subunit b